MAMYDTQLARKVADRDRRMPTPGLRPPLCPGAILCEGRKCTTEVPLRAQSIPGGAHYGKVAASDAQVATGWLARHVPPHMHEYKSTN